MVNTFCMVLFWKNMEKRLFFRAATAGFGIPNRRLRPDWGNAVGAAMTRLGSKGIRRYCTPTHCLYDGYLGTPYPSY